MKTTIEFSQTEIMQAISWYLQLNHKALTSNMKLATKLTGDADKGTLTAIVFLEPHPTYSDRD